MQPQNIECFLEIVLQPQKSMLFIKKVFNLLGFFTALLSTLYYDFLGKHSFSTYAQRGRGVKQKRTPCIHGGMGAYTWKYVRKNVPFCTCFVILSYAGSFYHALLS